MKAANSNTRSPVKMGKTRRRRKFFKFFSCLSKKSEDLEEVVGSSSPLQSSTSPIKDADSSDTSGVTHPHHSSICGATRQRSVSPGRHKTSKLKDTPSSPQQTLNSPPVKPSTLSTENLLKPPDSHCEDDNSDNSLEDVERRQRPSWKIKHRYPASACLTTAGRRQDDPPLAQQEDLQVEEQIEAETASKAESKPQDGVHGDVGADNEVDEEIAVYMPPPMEQLKSLQATQSTGTDEDRETCQNMDDGPGTTSTANSTSDIACSKEQHSDVGEPLENNMAATDSVDGPVSTITENEEPHEEISEEEANREKHRKKRVFVITELIDTERDYVRDLGLMVEGYMKMIQDDEHPMPEGMEGKDKIVFGNIHQIYDWHRETFSHEVEKCSDDPARVATLFIRYERKLKMYVKYCENKPKSEYVVAEYIEYFEELRKELGHKLQLPDLLIKPVQRIMKYQLLLKDILKHTDRMGDDTKELQQAVQVMCVVPKAANDMMNVGRLQGFEGKITAQGNLLLQETLMVMETMPKAVKSEQQKFKERRVFLFDQIIIFSEEIEKKKNNLSNPGYIYKNSLMVNKMELDEKGNSDPLTFALLDKTPRSDLKLVCQAPSEQVKQNWVSQINSILKMQRDFLTALTNPTKYNQFSKDSTK